MDLFSYITSLDPAFIALIVSFFGAKRSLAILISFSIAGLVGVLTLPCCGLCPAKVFPELGAVTGCPTWLELLADCANT